jgi:DNA polymerase-3 subunit beta
MKLLVLQENFSKALQISSRFVSNRAQLPVLSNVLLKSNKTKLFLLATNLEISIATSIGAKVETDGSITIPARTLSDIISNLSKGTLTLSTEDEHLSIEMQNFDATLMGISASEFPSIPETIPSTAFHIKREEFAKALSQVVFSASSDETRPVLTGVLFTASGDTLVLVGTDGHRLSQKKIDLPDAQKVPKTIVPKSALLEVSRIGTDEEDLTFAVNAEDKQVLFGSGDTVLSSRLIDGEFPPFEKIIPKQSTVVVRLDHAELLRAVKVASVFARDSGYVGKMKVLSDKIEITAESSKSGNQKMSVDAKVEGESLEVMFNLRFIEEFLQVVSGSEITIGLTDSNSPGVFQDSSDKSFLHLIMPVKIQ